MVKSAKLNKLSGDAKIYWNDAVIYAKPQTISLKPVVKITRGIMIGEKEGYLIIKNPKTVKRGVDGKHYVADNATNRGATFLCIPIGMISRIKNCKQTRSV